MGKHDNDFMQPETMYGLWYIMETKYKGTCCFPAEYFSKEELLKQAANGVTLEDIEEKVGWCSRLQAPGYLDTTEWDGPYDTEEEALEELKSLYWDDDDEEEEDGDGDGEGGEE